MVPYLAHHNHNYSSFVISNAFNPNAEYLAPILLKNIPRLRAAAIQMSKITRDKEHEALREECSDWLLRATKCAQSQWSCTDHALDERRQLRHPLGGYSVDG